MTDPEASYWKRAANRPYRRRRFLAAASAATLGTAGLGLVGCGDDDDDGAQVTPSGQATPGGQATPTASLPRGGTWKRATASALGFIRMPLNTAGDNEIINNNGGIWSRLVRVGGSELKAEPGYKNLSRMVNQDYKVVGDAAASWEVAGDGTSYTFTLADGVTWHSGRAFTSEDVKFTYEAIKDPNVGGGGSPFNLMAANVDKVQAIDPKTVKITLTKPTGYFLMLAATCNLADRETIDQREKGVLVGTGPFKFGNYDPNRGWDLVPHTGYHKKGLPLLDKVQFTIFASGTAIGTALEARDIDSGGAGSPEIEDRLLKSSDHHGIIPTGSGGRVIRLRTDIDPVRDKRVRQAIMLLVDSERVARDFATKFDVPGRLPWQPSSPAYDAALDKPVYDPKKAKQLLDAAGVGKGTKLKADILPSRADAPALAQLLQQELKAFGIELEINAREYAELLKLQTTGTFEHMLLGFGNWIKSGDPALTVLFADAYDGRMNAYADPAVPLRQRPGIKDEIEWLDMIEAAKDGTVKDWKKWNEKYLDVAWGNVLFRQYSTQFYTNKMQLKFDAEGSPYMDVAAMKA